MNNNTIFRALVLVATAACSPSTSLAAMFQPLGDLPGGVASATPISTGDPTFESHGGGVSPNGSIVVGSSVSASAPSSGNSEAYKWTAAGGIDPLGSHPDGIYYSTANSVTNGDVAVGYGDGTFDGVYTPGYGVVLRWAAPSGSTAPETMPMDAATNQYYYGYTGGHPIDGSGNRIVGYIGEIPFDNSDEAVLWVNGSLRHLGWLAPGPVSPPPHGDPFGGFVDYSYANAINTPGTHIVGSSVSIGTVPTQAVIWTDLTGTWATAPAAVGLGQIGGVGVGSGSTAHDIANNGQRVVGGGCTTDNCGDTPTGEYQAFAGTVGNANLTGLGVLPTNSGTVVARSEARAIAGDGTTVVGWSVTDEGILNDQGNPIAVTTHTAFIWDPVLTGGTMMNLKTYLTDSQGLGSALAGWTLKEANAISDDGTVIVGTGINPSGNYEAFRVALDLAAPVAGDYNDNGIVDTADYIIWRNTLGQNVPSGTGADGDNNGVIQQADYNIWMANYGKPAGAGATFNADAAVPEPAAALMLTLGLAMLLAAAGRPGSEAWLGQCPRRVQPFWGVAPATRFQQARCAHARL